jgi:maltooligosyltrehalose trehalohydrolase
MRRKHEMPFGAEVLDDHRVRFRLWAPNATSVGLRIVGNRDLEMPAAGHGWFEVVTACDVGAEYQYAINHEQLVPDPASRFQPAGVHGPGQVVDPLGYEWHDQHWRGRSWEETVLYELHIGTFTPQGTYSAAEAKLDYLAELGVTAVELMPVSSFPGTRNWGYDGVLPYAPASTYGRPEDLKHFIDAAHGKNLMVFLDVVYNHFGPEGNYLSLYAPQFFTDRHITPWGPAINFDGPCHRTVRDYFIHNALYWLEEYHFDGLRFDAVHAIKDDSHPDILEELASKVQHSFGRERHIHLVLENDNNAAHYLRRSNDGEPLLFTAQWNDDIHHAFHVLTTGENDGYYGDYASNPARHLGRCLAEGFSFQGESSPYRDGEKRGETSRQLPPAAFVSFLQNHDQVGNRAFGERLIKLCAPEALKAATAILLLAPSPPLLFMGEEFGADTPFLFFCDFGPELAPKVTEGRRSEFARFAQFSSPEAQARIPDPSSERTFLKSKLDWNSLADPQYRAWLALYKELLALRAREIVPRLGNLAVGSAKYEVFGSTALRVHWPFRNRGGLVLLANFSKAEIRIPETPPGRVLYTSTESAKRDSVVAPQSSTWLLNE